METRTGNLPLSRLASHHRSQSEKPAVRHARKSLASLARVRAVRFLETPVESEKWRPAPGFEGLYEVSSLGRVKSLARTTSQGVRLKETIRKASAQKSGHLWLRFCKNGRRTKQNIHRLVLETFVGPCPEGLETCHHDDDPANNTLENLRWGTRSSNMRDRIRNGRAIGLIGSGRPHPNRKLNNEQVLEIRGLMRSGQSQMAIARIFGVSQNLVSKIKRGLR